MTILIHAPCTFLKTDALTLSFFERDTHHVLSRSGITRTRILHHIHILNLVGAKPREFLHVLHAAPVDVHLGLAAPCHLYGSVALCLQRRNFRERIAHRSRLLQNGSCHSSPHRVALDSCLGQISFHYNTVQLLGLVVPHGRVRCHTVALAEGHGAHHYSHYQHRHVLYADTAKEIAGYNVQTGNIGLDVAIRLVIPVQSTPTRSLSHTTDETAALRNDIHRIRYEQFHATHKRMDVYFLILCDNSFAQIHADASTDGIETGTMKRFTSVDVLVAAKIRSATDAFALIGRRYRTTQPLVMVSAIAVEDKMHSDI